MGGGGVDDVGAGDLSFPSSSSTFRGSERSISLAPCNLPEGRLGRSSGFHGIIRLAIVSCYATTGS